MPTASIDDATWYYDTDYLGHPYLIAAGVLETDDGLLIVDPGPTTALQTLTEALHADGYDWDDVHALLLTHIHLDHAGATGSIVERAPHLKVYVHGRGAPHMIRPERLLNSARRIYGDEMDTLWGEFLPVPEDAVQTLDGNETLSLGGRTLEVAYTPGHAQHHVSYLDPASGTAFIGDVGGMRVTGCEYIVPVMPPPDVDLAAWSDSLATVREWAPTRIFTTHFGPHDDVAHHLDVMAGRLTNFADAVRHTLDATEHNDDEALAQRFAEKELDRMRATVEDEALRTAYARFGQPRDSWYGLARYWRKRAQAGSM
jgi:glyoxylase-like metal-dependent hydrolase (beta-lactamase superfamily II)